VADRPVAERAAYAPADDPEPAAIDEPAADAPATTTYEPATTTYRRRPGLGRFRRS
jgi:hypothetical protein